MKTIKDEFTKLKGKVSRQRIYQLRKVRDGRCAKCGKKESNRGLCEFHARRSALNWKKWNRKNLKGKPHTKLNEYKSYGRRNEN